MTLSFSPFFAKLFTVLLGFMGIGFIIMIHELGHWLSCKLFNVKTPSFSIGFGPRLFSKRMWDTEFSLSVLPLGGYVEIAGMQEVGQGDQEHAHDDSEQSFAAKPYYQKMIILLAGIAVNVLFACIALTFLFMLRGVPEHAAFTSLIGTTRIKTVVPGSPAEKAGLEPGDEIREINGIGVRGKEIHKISAMLNKKLGQTVALTIQPPDYSEALFRKRFPDYKEPISMKHTTTTAGITSTDTIRALVTLPLDVPCDNPQLGVTFELAARPAYGFNLSNIWKAKKDAGTVIYSWIASTFRSLANMFTERHMKGLGGPLAVIHSITTSAQSGWITFLIALCFVSVGIACLNLLPLPIFDGGQVVFYSIEALTRRSLESIRTVIHYISWFSVLALILLLTWRDIVRIFFG